MRGYISRRRRPCDRAKEAYERAQLALKNLESKKKKEGKLVPENKPLETKEKKKRKKRKPKKMKEE